MLQTIPRFAFDKVRRLDPGLRIYAIGDIHGHYSLLQQMHQKISTHMAAHPCERAIEVFLGDYIDRGPQPSEVLDHLMHHAPAAHERICLSGNHEKSLLRYLKEPEFLMRWSRFGGLDTLSAYGVDVDQPLTEEDCRTARPEFAANFPADQKSFLETLPLSVSFGDYFFAHAGVRPGIPLE
ncbi:MAG: metallophosphoesterase, partial [Pseudomonadota bacterium]